MLVRMPRRDPSIGSSHTARPSQQRRSGASAGASLLSQSHGQFGFDLDSLGKGYSFASEVFDKSSERKKARRQSYAGRRAMMFVERAPCSVVVTSKSSSSSIAKRRIGKRKPSKKKERHRHQKKHTNQKYGPQLVQEAHLILRSQSIQVESSSGRRERGGARSIDGGEEGR